MKSIMLLFNFFHILLNSMLKKAEPEFKKSRKAQPSKYQHTSATNLIVIAFNIFK